MRYLVISFMFISVFYQAGIAQQTPLYSQYMLNEFIINPAVTGRSGMTSVSLTGRKQWLGWENAPETYSSSFSTRLLKATSPFIRKKINWGGSTYRNSPTGRVALGASIIKDKNGAVNKTRIDLTYAYHISLYQAQLSFGFTFMSNQFKIDKDLANFGDPNDPLSHLIGASAYSPDAALGVDYSTHEYHVGISIFNLFQSPVKLGKTSANYYELRQVRHYYLLAAYKNIMPYFTRWEYEPSIVARGTEKLQGTAEASIRFIYEQEYWFGFSFRTSKDIIAFLGVKFNRVLFGYSYDYGFNEMSRMSYGSHEISMAVRFGDSAKRFRFWQRY